MDSVPGSTCSPAFVIAEALPARRRTASGPGVLGQPVCPVPAFGTWARTGYLRFPGVPSHTSARLSDPGRTGRTSPFAVRPMLPPGPTRRRLQHEHDIGAQPRASVSAAYASRAALPPPMQGSLPAGGLRLCREGVDYAVGCCWQHHVVRLDARQFLEDGARRVAETGTALPHLQTLPQHEGEEADEDVSLHAVLALMPDRPDGQLLLLDAERRLRLSELDVRLP